MRTNHILKLDDFKRSSVQIKTATIQKLPTTVDLIGHEHKDSDFFRALERKGVFLNRDQLSILLSPSKHNIINALAGVGKTSSLVALAAYKIQCQLVEPQSMLIIAYSKRSAGELSDRFKRILPESNIKPSTLHGFCFQLLRFNGYKNWSLLTDELQKQAIFRMFIRKRRLANHYTSDYVTSSISYHVNSFKELTDPILQNLSDDYEAFKREKKLMDFDDLLLKAYELLLMDPQLLEKVNNQFKCVIVDEFQDLNKLQFLIIRLLVDNHGESYFFGDRQQSIFSFRGASPDLIDDATYHLSNISQLTLSVNYRSTNTILGLGNHILSSMDHNNDNLLIATMESNKTPGFYRPSDSNEEAKQILAIMQSRLSNGTINYKDVAILFRSNSAVKDMLELLLTNRIPTKCPSAIPLIYEHEKIRIIIAHLKLAFRQDSLNSVLDLSSTLYIAASRIKQHFADYKDNLPGNCLLSMADMSDLEDYQIKLIINRLLLLDQIKTLSPEDAINVIVGYPEVKRHLLSTNQENDPNEELIDELKDTAASFNSIESFISNIDSLQHQKKSMLNQQEADAVTLTSIHAAKGLEWPLVFLIGCNDGILPHHSSIEPMNKSIFSPLEFNLTSVKEELRLLYVAITRAKQELYISAPKNYHGSPTKASRFLEAFFNANN